MKKFILLALLLSSCNSAPEEELVDNKTETSYEGIEGEWTVSGTLEGGFSWFATYTFTDEEYHLSGYPPLDDKGTYTIKSQEGTTYVLEMSPEAESEDAFYILELTLAKDGQTLDLNGQTYTRVK